jgi:hypothetical protein
VAAGFYKTSLTLLAKYLHLMYLDIKVKGAASGY